MSDLGQKKIGAYQWPVLWASFLEDHLIQNWDHPPSERQIRLV